MPNTATGYKHIQIDDSGTPTIAGTTMKVTELVTSHLTYGWSPEELHFQFPHIGLSKIYSALSYYYDHQDILDTDIQQRFEQVEQLRQTAPPSNIAQKLKAKGKLS
jgi:uncharacterized protein (DUF433 family)